MSEETKNNQGAKEVALKPAPTKIYGSYLEDRIISVKPIESNGKWSNLLVKGQEKRKDAFLLDKAKRSFQVPLNDVSLGGGVKAILNDEIRILIKKYEASFPDGMTQKEFFEKELGVDLNYTLPREQNFWRVNKLGKVIMTKEGLKLNLSLPLDMLKYLILLSNRKKICSNYEERLSKASYEFVVVDEGKLTSQRINEAKVKADAYIKYGELASNIDSIKGFIRSLGKTIPASANEDWLKAEVLNVVEADSERFMNIVNHPQYKGRIFVQEAVEAGSIILKGKDRYTLDNGVELGDLTSTVNFLMDPINQEVKLRIKATIDIKK